MVGEILVLCRLSSDTYTGNMDYYGYLALLYAQSSAVLLIVMSSSWTTDVHLALPSAAARLARCLLHGMQRLPVL